MRGACLRGRVQLRCASLVRMKASGYVVLRNFIPVDLQVLSSHVTHMSALETIVLLFSQLNAEFIGLKRKTLRKAHKRQQQLCIIANICRTVGLGVEQEVEMATRIKPAQSVGFEEL